MSPKGKERFIALVLDTETHFKSLYNKLIYHIGWTRGDIRCPDSPRIYREFYVKEFLPLEYWQHSFVDEKTGTRKFWKNDSRATRVQQRAFDNPELVKSWEEIRTIFEFDASVSDGVGSYNWGFDGSAIDITNRRIFHNSLMDTIRTQKFCLMDYAFNMIINRDFFTFVKTAPQHIKDRLKSKSGKTIGYNVETMIRYIKGDFNWDEPHTALFDSMGEFDIACEIDKRNHYTLFKDRFLGTPRSVSYIDIKNQTSSIDKMKNRAKRKLV
tara:strand:+ start:192 stop:998 length:807 start_codon:yes stop_codon:yes gene_type:complete